MTGWNTAFWVLFVIMGILVVSATFVRILYLDLMLGFLVIAIGLLKLGEEMSDRELRARHNNINESIKYLTHQLDSSNFFTNRIKEKHETRFLRMDTKRAEIEQIVEDKFDSLAKKLIDHENQLKDITKATVHVSKKHDSFAKEAQKKLKDVDKIREKTVQMSRSIGALKGAKTAKAAKALKTSKKKR
jgi:hypothetical protein